MRWVVSCLVIASLLLGVQIATAAHPAPKEPEVSLNGPLVNIAGLSFMVPAKWQSMPPESAARIGQWRVPPLHNEGDGGEVVAFYFGPGVGGDSKENIEAWIGTMFNAEGHPAAAEMKSHQTGGFKISQVVIFGTYNQIVPVPGIPPASKPNYGLLGAVIESPQGLIYWRFTGPEPLITANLPLFNKIIDSVKPLPSNLDYSHESRGTHASPGTRASLTFRFQSRA